MTKFRARRSVFVASLGGMLSSLSRIDGAIAQALAPSKDATLNTKQQILELAEFYAGTGDPDFAKQRSFDPLITRLLAERPQPPIRERLSLLAGAWKQVWGPYNYRGSERIVDPEINVTEIYQVVFTDGYYYNVTSLINASDRKQERIALLRGEYQFDDSQNNVLNVRFTRYPGLSRRPDIPKKLFELPKLIETREVNSDINIVPTWVVKVFFGGGALKEVYTDADLRILYGARSNRFERPALYIMKR
jgi:hypothetical protein